MDREIRELILRTCRWNPTWGASRIQSELLLLGYEVAEFTVAKYMIRQPEPFSQNLRTFLENQRVASLPYASRLTKSLRPRFSLMPEALCAEARALPTSGRS